MPKPSTSAKDSIEDGSQSSGNAARYYDQDRVMQVEDKMSAVDDNTNTSVSTKGQTSDDVHPPKPKRKKTIGTLPSFIPIG